MALPRKNPGKKPVVPWEQATFLGQHVCKQSRVTEPEAPEAGHFDPLTFRQPIKLCLQGIQPCFVHTSDLWHISSARVTRKGITLGSQQQSHLQMLHLHLQSLYSFPTHFYMAYCNRSRGFYCPPSLWEECSITTSIENSKKNMLVVKQKALWHSTGKL